MSTRYVKLGRKPLEVCVGHHWAVLVDNGCGTGYWYEILGARKGDKNSPNVIKKSYGRQAASGAGALGGEIVGMTTKSDKEIGQFNYGWVQSNRTYGITGDNCQKYGIDFISWLTDKNYRLNHMLEAGTPDDKECSSRTLVVAHDGQAYACASTWERRVQLGNGLFQAGIRGPSAEAEAIAGPGLYAGANASLVRMEANYGNVATAHVDINVNTGVGFRGGNAEAHLLGFGGKIGSDGLEVDTPLGGVRLPWMAAPINFVGNLFR